MPIEKLPREVLDALSVESTMPTQGEYSQASRPDYILEITRVSEDDTSFSAKFGYPGDSKQVDFNADSASGWYVGEYGTEPETFCKRMRVAPNLICVQSLRKPCKKVDGPGDAPDHGLMKKTWPDDSPALADSACYSIL